ncbi:hypothetical protein CsSME_00039039 [Camellia sinensis var. sinensis]
MDDKIKLTDNINEAHALLALQSKLNKNPRIQAAARSHGIPIYVMKTSSLMQLTKAIRALITDHEDDFKDFESDDKINAPQKIEALEVKMINQANPSIRPKWVGGGRGCRAINQDKNAELFGDGIGGRGHTDLDAAVREVAAIPDELAIERNSEKWLLLKRKEAQVHFLKGALPASFCYNDVKEFQHSPHYRFTY